MGILRILTKPKWQMAIFCLAHASIFALFFTGVYQGESAAELYFCFANSALDGEMPYRDFPMEYPPLALLFFILPRLITSSFQAYDVAFTLEMFFFDLVGLFLIAAISRRQGLNLWVTLGIYTIALAALGPIVSQRYDLIPAIMVLLALYAYYRGNNKTFWAILALGTMTKLYPVIIAPLFLMEYVRHSQYRYVRDGIITFALVTAALAIPFAVLSPGGFLESFGYHVQRVLQIESTYASFLLVSHSLNPALQLVFDSGSWNITSPVADILALVSPLVLLLFLVVIYWFYRNVIVAESPVMPPDKSDILRLVNFALLAILAFIITGKILSPQFLVWLYPMLPLVTGRMRNLIWVIFVAIGAMTYYVYPMHYAELVNLERTEIVVLLLRNLMLLSLFAILLLKLRHPVFQRGEARLLSNE